MSNKITINDIAYCGINCRMCNLTTILPEAAENLHQIMKDDGWEFFGSQVHPEFDDFWKVLNSLAVLKESCPLCKGGCGDPECKFRVCAREKGLELCFTCDSFPCTDLKSFYDKRYPYLEASAVRMKEIGLEEWLKEQTDLVKRSVRNEELTKKCL